MLRQLQIELDWYEANRARLSQDYDGKTLVIRGQRVVGVHKNELVAHQDAAQKYELGTFLIRQIFRKRV